jgi:hypothetical protein
MGLFTTRSVNNTEHTSIECCNGECRYDECRVFSYFMLSITMLSVIMPNAVMLSAAAPQNGLVIGTDILIFQNMVWCRRFCAFKLRVDVLILTFLGLKNVLATFSKIGRIFFSNLLATLLICLTLICSRILNAISCISESTLRHDTQHNDTQHNDIKRNWLHSKTQENDAKYKTWAFKNTSSLNRIQH